MMIADMPERIIAEFRWRGGLQIAVNAIIGEFAARYAAYAAVKTSRLSARTQLVERCFHVHRESVPLFCHSRAWESSQLLSGWVRHNNEDTIRYVYDVQNRRTGDSTVLLEVD